MSRQPLKSALWTDTGPQFTLSLQNETLCQGTKTKMLRTGAFCWNKAEVIIKLFDHSMLCFCPAGDMRTLTEDQPWKSAHKQIKSKQTKPQDSKANKNHSQSQQTKKSVSEI